MSSAFEIQFSTRLEYGATQSDYALNTHSAEADRTHTMRMVSSLMTSIYSLAGDLHGMGPTAHTLLRRQSVTLRQRVASALESIDRIRADLNAARGTFLWPQLQALGIDENSRNLRLHIGCGGHHLPDWINLDNYPAPLATNLDWGLPLPDGSAQYVFLSHVLEHLFYPEQSTHLLDEIRRVLMPGGIVRVIVPDIEQCLRAYVERDDHFFRERRRHFRWLSQDATLLEQFLAYAGAGPAPEHLFEHHKFGYDFETLQSCLQRAGFIHIRRCDFQQSPHQPLRVDHASSNAHAGRDGKYYSLFVEAEVSSSV